MFAKMVVTPAQMKAAKGHMESLKKARGQLQPLVGSLGKEKQAVLKVALKQAGIKRPLSLMIADSLMITQNLMAISQGKALPYNISTIDVGFRIVEMNQTVRVINDLKKKELIK